MAHPTSIWYLESTQKEVRQYLSSGRSIHLYSNDPRLLYTLPKETIPLIIRKAGSTHEYQIGYCMNALRSLVSNFPFTYVRMPPTNQLNYRFLDETDILLEYIPGPTLGDLLRNCRADWLLKIYLEIISALEISYQYFHFVHHNIDTQNIIIRHLTGRPMIVNFELASVRINGKTLHVDTSFDCVGFDSPIHDPLRLLISIMSGLEINGNVNCLDRLRPVLEYFLHSHEADTRIPLESLNPHDLYKLVVAKDQFSYDVLKSIVTALI